MPSENGETDLSKVRADLDTVQVDTAENVSEMQEYAMGYTETQPEDVKYRVVMADFGCMENDILFTDYYADYYDAEETFDMLCDDKKFISQHDKASVIVNLDKCYRGMSQIFWETIKKSVVYKDD